MELSSFPGLQTLRPNQFGSTSISRRRPVRKTLVGSLLLGRVEEKLFLEM